MIRIHTRVPVTLPTRVTPGLVKALTGKLMTCVVTQYNHPREITAEAREACRLLRGAGFMLLNQSVLLAGVNDSVEVMKALCEELVYALGAKPYYLHHCDLARGISHFRTGIDHGLEIMRALRGHVSGLCLPTYVLDLPGGYGKIPLGPNYVQARDGDHWSFATYDGDVQAYREILPHLPTSGNET